MAVDKVIDPLQMADMQNRLQASEDEAAMVIEIEDTESVSI